MRGSRHRRVLLATACGVLTAGVAAVLVLVFSMVDSEMRRDAFDRGEAVRAAALPWTSFGKYGLTHKGPGVVVPMYPLRDITASGVVGDASRAWRETGEQVVVALHPRMVQVAREFAGSGQ